MKAGPVESSDGFAPRLLAWFEGHGRHDLPWQHPRTPYRVWLSEIMLQQTQVVTATVYFERFVSSLPDVPALAAAPLDDVLALWSGLGYYARARNLHAAARLCVERHEGHLPRDMDALVALPGIGRSTAAAVLSQAWGERCAILDGNVKRVLARYHGIDGWPGRPVVEKRMWTIAEHHVAHPCLDAAAMPDYTQAQMDLGATICTRANPACVLCPLQADCIARIEGRTGSLPTPRPAKALPQRSAQVMWLEDPQGRVLLQRRPSTGVWASLWSLPQVDDAAGARAWWAANARATPPGGTELEPIDHAFSHYRLRLYPSRWRGVDLADHLRDNDDLRWLRYDQLRTLGIPAPVRRLLESSCN
ncbi:A/G-specific adenine glycosylase [Lysobacter sp. A3-1-A15]|uniref:A/G-specific adenine glycosylase n=1 Tax=Novilysobacter viscosus TaxID=3098602 RepID=UPI002ED7D9E8